MPREINFVRSGGKSCSFSDQNQTIFTFGHKRPESTKHEIQWNFVILKF